MTYSGYDLEEEELEIRGLIIGKITMNWMRYIIKDKEILSLPPKVPPRERKQVGNDVLPPSSSNILNDICERQQLMIWIHRSTN